MKIILRSLLVTLLVSCSAASSSEKKFEKSGISFTCPEGWEITGEENIDSSGYYLTIEREGFSSSGLMTISWVNDSVDLVDYLEIYKNEFQTNTVYKYTNLSFSAPMEIKFNGIDAMATKFTTSILGLEYEGIVYCFYGNDKTLSILKQEAIEDKSKNRDGFDSIEESFVVN